MYETKRRRFLQTAVVIGGGSILTGNAVGDDCENLTSGSTVDGTIQSDDDEDCYRLDVTKGDVCEFQLEKTALEDVRMSVEWPDFNNETLFDESEALLETRVTVEETGYIELEVYGRDVGNESYDYSLTVTREAGADQWPSTDYADVQFGETYEGTIHSPDDEDHLRFEVAEGDVCEFQFEKEPLEDVRMSVEWPDWNNETLFDESEALLETRITAENTGYVELEIYGRDVEMDTFDWTLTATREPGADRWPSTEYADVEFGETYEGTIHSPDDEDHLRLAVAEGDVCEFQFEKTPREDVRMSVEWPDWNNETLFDEGEDLLKTRITAENTGYVELEIYGRGVEMDTFDWTLTATREAGADQWPSTEYADVESGAAYEGTIHSPDDEDHLRTTIDEGESIALELSKRAGEDVRLELSWPEYNSTTLFDEGATVFSETVTAESNGYLELEVYGRDVGMDTFDWSLGIDVPADVPDDGPDENPGLEDYTDEDGVIRTDGLRNAIDDWRSDEIDTDLLRDVIDSWRSGDPVGE